MAVKILIVDDEPDVSAMISQQYENKMAGFEVSLIFAVNGVDALNVLEQNPDVEIVLTDINMPIMDGLELLANINKKWPLIKVIVISGYGDMKNIRKAMNQMAFDFIIKPFEFNDLEKTVGSAIVMAKGNYLIAYKKATEHDKLVEIETELEAAKNIQSAFIPTNFHTHEHTDFEIYGTMKPAREVGGDFFDFFRIDESNLGLVIADVSGKGVPAALFMTMSRAALRCFSSKKISECLRETNEFLCTRNESCMFVTLFFGILNTSKKELTYCNAGHNPPFILSTNGSLQEIGRCHGTALGVSDKFEIAEHTVTLKDNDILILYTDGVTEAMNANNEMFSEFRLKTFLFQHATLTVKELTDQLVKNIQNFAKEAIQSDDITVFCIKMLKNCTKKLPRQEKSND